MAPFLADKNVVQQGSLSSEPYSIAQALGRPPVVLLIADAGFSAYQTTIAISRRMANEKEDLVQRFVDASLEGWSQYLKGRPGHRRGERADQAGQPRTNRRPYRYAIEVLNERGIVLSGDARRGRHWGDERRAVEELLRVDDRGRRAEGLDVTRTYSLEFVNKGGKAMGERDTQVSEEHEMLRDLVKVRAQRVDALGEEHPRSVRCRPAGGALSERGECAAV